VTAPRNYATPAAFKAALEDRLKLLWPDGAALNRRRQLLVFDRFLARLARQLGNAVVLKGGLVMEWRLMRARATKDIDLSLSTSKEAVLPALQVAGRLDLGDFMSFEVQPDLSHPEIENIGMPYEGLRFRVEGKLAGNPYGSRFGLDIAFGDPVSGVLEIQEPADLLAFAGIPPPRIQIYPIETHIAEKLHAYSLPRTRPNSRIKDLPDLALLSTVRPLSSDELRRAIERTFAYRASHAVPGRLSAPPDAWVAPYEAMARADDLPWTTLAAVLERAQRFLNPLLSGEAHGHWDPVSGIWQSSQVR
jgi:Nucleotidyl transferase AbiEii toxin, Type IV TA system